MLVKLTTQDLNNSIPVCTSRDISATFEKRHDNVLRDIDAIINQLGSPQLWGHLFIETKYQHEQNQQWYREYLITRDGFTLLAMGFTGVKALQFKLDYIKAFNVMENELKARVETRHIGMSVRKNMTQSIKDNLDNEHVKYKGYNYAEYTKLVYKKVIGTTVKKYKEKLGLKERDNLRNYLTLEQLESVQALEQKIAMYIETLKDMELTDKEVYSKVVEMLNK